MMTFLIYGKIKHVPNYQSDKLWVPTRTKHGVGSHFLGPYQPYHPIFIMQIQAAHPVDMVSYRPGN